MGEDQVPLPTSSGCALTARRIERAGAAGTARAARLLAETFDDPAYGAEALADGWFVFTPHEVPLWGALGVGFEAPVGATVIDAVERLSGAHGLPARFDVCPLADRDLDERLAARGYAASPSCEVWVRPVAVGSLPPAPHGDVVIRAVDARDEDAVEQFVRTVARGYREGGEPAAWNLAIGCHAARLPNRHAFLATLGGAVAGGGLLGVTDGLASFTFTSTLPAFRRRGVQGALLRARLERAREAGADTACVQCMLGSPTARNAARLGFQRAYVRTWRTRPA